MSADIAASAALIRAAYRRTGRWWRPLARQGTASLRLCVPPRSLR